MKNETKKDKVGVQDIAKVLKISASTVSRALNDHPRISKSTKERVKQTAARLGYNPGVPQLMNPEKTEVIAVLVPSVNSNVYREMVAGINRYLDEQGFRLFIVDTLENSQEVTTFFKTYKKYGISGIIQIVSDRSMTADSYNSIKKDALPLVTICEPDEETGFSSVLPDMFQGVDKIVKYLKSLNVKNIALILDDKDKPEDYHLATTFEMVMDVEANNKGNLSVFYINKVDNRFISEMETVIQNNAEIHALLVKDTVSALETSALCKRIGKRIPEDILLIAAGTDYTFEGLSNNLSLLKFPGYNMGYEAARLLFDQLNNPGIEKISEVVPVNFILKSSAIRLNK